MYFIIINRMIAEELTEYLIASQIDVQVRPRVNTCLIYFAGIQELL
jgi:hypothetical protein